MKQTILILSILFSVQCFGQKWHLNSVDEGKDYPYEYWFQFEDLDDTSSYKLTSKFGLQNSHIGIFDNQGNAIPLANIYIHNVDTGSERNLTSDFDGQAEVPLKKGKYRIEISAVGYCKFNLEIEVKREQYIELQVFLGSGPELTIYQINSKSELTEDEIFEIMECVKRNGDQFYKDCSDEKKCIVMIQI